MARYAKVARKCKAYTSGCNSVEYRTPRGLTNNWGIDESGYCAQCRQDAKDAGRDLPK